MAHLRFSAAQRTLHWLMAAAIAAMLFIGVGMVSTLSPRFLTLQAIHRPLGILILLLAVLRLALRLYRGAPPLPADLPPSLRLAAKGSHALLYALMLAMPLLGWGMLSAGGYPVVLGGALRLPAILPHDAALHAALWAAHRWLAMALFALVLAHLAGGLFHWLVRRDGVFHAMAPWGRDRRG